MWTLASNWSDLMENGMEKPKDVIFVLFLFACNDCLEYRLSYWFESLTWRHSVSTTNELSIDQIQSKTFWLLLRNEFVDILQWLAVQLLPTSPVYF